MSYAFLKPRGMVDPVLGLGEGESYDDLRGKAEVLRDNARDTIGKYTDDVDMSPEEAQRALRRGEAWARDNQKKLEAFKEQNGANAETPADLALMMRQDEAQDLVRACYWASAAGAAPQISGAALEASQTGELGMTPSELQVDLAQRNKTLASVVEMDTPGKTGKSVLEEIFNPTPQPLNGLGAAPVALIAIVVIGAVLAVAAIAFAITMCLDNYWKTKALTKLCEKAQEKGDSETLKQCMVSLKPPSTEEVGKQFIDKFGNVAMVIGVAAVVIGGAYLYAITPKVRK